jgi:hypothetical protein
MRNVHTATLQHMHSHSEPGERLNVTAYSVNTTKTFTTHSTIMTRKEDILTLTEKMLNDPNTRAITIIKVNE